MHELCTLGSERGAISNARPYRNPQVGEFGWPSGIQQAMREEQCATKPKPRTALDQRDLSF